MKKTLAIILSLIMVFTIIPMAVSVSAYTNGYYTYSVSNGEATITKCDTSISGDITIPSTLGGYPVTSIGRDAFSGCTSLTSVTIPNSVTSIGGSAFYRCGSLKSIFVSENNNSYASIDGVLFDKNKTKIICYPAGKTDKSYIIPDSVTSIGNDAFSGCKSLASITIPNRVTSIGHEAFSGCKSLASITIPNRVTSIGWNAFEYCESLTSVTIGNSVTSIDGYAFYNCTSLTSITIPNSVKSIGNYAFEGCTSLTSVTIGDSVTSIGYRAFYGCTSLTSVTIGNSVTSIDGYAFYNCTSLTNVYYGGTQKQWKKIEIGYHNSELTNANIHYNSSGYNSAYDVHNSVDGSFDISTDNLSCDIDLGDMQGPSIDIFGYKIDLIKVSTKLKFSLKSVSVSTDIDENAKTVKVILGYKDSEKANLSNKTKFKEEYNQLKELYKYCIGGKGDKNNLAKYRKLKADKLSKVMGNSGNLGIKAEIKTTGYIQFSYETGSLTPKECGIVVAGECGITLTHQPSIFYITTGLKGSAEVSTAVAFDNNGKISFDKIATEFALTANLGVGVGAKALNIYIEGGLEGKINLKINVSYNTTVTSNLTGSLYAEYKAVLVSAKKTWQFSNTQLLNKTINKKFLSNNSKNANIDYQLLERDYSFTKNSTSKSKKYLSVPNDNFKLTNVYQYSAPQYVNLSNGNTVLIFVGDNGTKDSYNRTSIMYSVFNGTVWTAPQVLAESGTYQDNPTVFADGDKVYVVWQQAKNAFNENTTVEQALAGTDLYYSCYKDGAFSNSVCVNNYTNSVYEDQYSICEENGNVLISWHENSENSVLNDRGRGLIKYRTLNNGTFSDVTTVTETDNKICETVGNLKDGVSTIYYVEQNDDSYILKANQNILDESSSITGLEIDDGILRYINEEKLYSCDGTNVYSEDVENINNFQYVSVGDKKVLTTLVSTGLKNELYVSEYNEDKFQWGKFSQFTDFGCNIRSYSPLINNNGVLTVACNAVEVNSDFDDNTSAYGDASLVVTGKCDYNDIALDYLYYDEELVEPNTELPLEYKVINNSNNTLTEFYANLYDKNNNLLRSEKVNCSINPYSSNVYNINYSVPENLTLRKLTLKISIDNEEADLNNNSSSCEIGFSDVEVSNISIVEKDDGWYVTGTITNNGYSTAENIVIKATSSRDMDNEFESGTIIKLDPSESDNFSYLLPNDLLYIDSELVMNAVYIDVETDTTESSVTNNSGKVVFDTLDEEYEEISTLTNGIGLQMRSGASIRINDKTGIRFYSFVNSNSISALRELGAEVTLGTLIAPEDFIENENLSFEMGNGKFVDVVFDSEEYYSESGFVGIVGSIVNVLRTNVNRKFVGRSYAIIKYKDFERIVYADFADDISNNSRSIAFLAHSVKNDTQFYDGLTTAQRMTVDRYNKLYVDDEN